MQADKRWQSVTEFVAALDVRDLSQSQPPARVRQNFLATPWQFAFIGAAVVGILVAAVIAGKFITGEPKVAQEVLATQSVPTVFRTPLPQLTSIAPSRVPLIIIVTATPTLTPTPTRTPTPTPTPSFYSATLSESLRLDILPEGAQTFSGHCVDTVGKIDGNARLVLAEIDSDVARGVVKLKVLIAIPKANYANGMISPNTTAYSTIDSNPIGRIRLENCFNQTEWPAELVGNDPKDPSKINVVVEGWVQERTLRSQR
ncbi:MAG: hypothetical protein HY070_11745 [Chloroflexi bacterium]|nr:hypothetical protein [Chloroflexota bacterium]